MQIERRKFTEFDFFMDEDIRAKRIGILCMEKTLTTVLNQSLFRVREKAVEYHKKRINDFGTAGKKLKFSDLHRQMREIKWSSLNLIRSFIAVEFTKKFLDYWKNGSIPILFFNAPFTINHQVSICNFFTQLSSLKISQLQSFQNNNAILFLDNFNTSHDYQFEDLVRKSNNLSRCFRLDSRANDLMQLTDLLLGITVFKMKQKQTISKSKLNLIKGFDQEYEKAIKEISRLDGCIYYIK